MARTKRTAQTPAPAPAPAPTLDAATAAYRAERAKRATKAPKVPALPKPPKTHDSRGRLLATGLPCLCGCGAPTTTPKARFLSGHDAKLRKAVLAVPSPRPLSVLPDVVQPFFAAGEVVAGLGVEGDEIVDLKVSRNGADVGEEEGDEQAA